MGIQEQYVQNATYCAYGWVSAVMLVPLLVQDIAAKNGVEASNHSIPCDTTIPDYKCVMRVFGENNYLDPGTISLYVSSFSAVISFIVSLSIAAIADHGAYRKILLVAFSILGCLTSLGFFIIQKPSLFWVTVILSPLGWACYNVSSVFSNAFLPIYVRVHPKVLESSEKASAKRTLRQMDQVNRSISSLGSSNSDSIDSSTSNSNNVSLQGYTLSSPTGTSTTLYSTMEQRKVEEQVSNDLSAWCAGAANIGAMAVQDFKTFKAMRQLTQVTKFIFAWFILSDGVNTVISLLYVITYQDLKFSHTKSLIMTIVISFMAFIGAYVFLYIRKIWQLSTKFMVLFTLGLYSLLTGYFVITPYFTTEFGLRHEWEAWISVVYLGLIMSTFYGVARVMMAELCPEGDENEWFSLFQLADKGSSWIGPFITGAIQSVTGDFRTGFWFPLALFAAGGALLLTVDINKGKDEAIRYKMNQQARHRLLSSIPPITVTSARESLNQPGTHQLQSLGNVA
ncbi:Autophagy protein 22 [Mortierella polycephala]|uniref:Autophagy-related protein n=1 Tax=Mortierella polycephala TaxID=41804 RepID=A0A9P6QBE4_9FUNG|nr:Autophagy protein 22 [Mortierella polycephala]